MPLHPLSDRRGVATDPPSGCSLDTSAPLSGRHLQTTADTGSVGTSTGYFVVSNDERQEKRVEQELVDYCFDAVRTHDTDTTTVTLGGDGTTLYVPRTYPDRTTLRVRTNGSVQAPLRP